MKTSLKAMARWLFIIPILLIAYFGFMLLSGSTGGLDLNMLGLGIAQQDDDQERTSENSVSEELAAALRAKEEELDKRETDIKKREQELSVWENDLRRMRNEIIRERDELDKDKAAFAQQEEERKSERVKQIAQTLKSTKAGVAAAQLQALYQKNRVTALYVISNLDSRSAGKIFTKMTRAEVAAQILEDFNNWNLSENSDQ